MTKRNSAHTTAQKAGRQRDNGVCQICGSRNHPEGHHTFDYQYGGAPTINNIVTLCHSCHRKVHNGKMDVFII